jgi:hypothetical protein
MTKTARMKEALDLDSNEKSVMAEHVQAMIRAYGIGGITDSLVDRMCFEIIFLDPLTVRHFEQFQHMWDRRESNQEPFLEWWTQFKAWIRDCIDTVRASNNKLQQARYEAYRDNCQGF